MRASTRSWLGLVIWLGTSALAIAAIAPSPDTQTRTAPANLHATVSTANRVDLAWDALGLGEDGFNVERAPDAGGAPGSFEEIATLPASTTTYGDKGLGAAAPLWYRVRAYRSSDYGAYCVPVRVS